MRQKKVEPISENSERGAALMTVVLVSLLLGTACIAMLTAVGASSRNNTDALSEAKAYWAAESGLQATINILRNGGVDYTDAINNPTLVYDASTFPAGLQYVDGRVTMNSEAQYAVTVRDPDASLPYLFQTYGSFRAPTGALAQVDNTIPKICFPNCDPLTVDRTEVRYNPVGSTQPNFAVNRSIGTFEVSRVGLGGAVPLGITFRIEYVLTSPRDASRTIRGTIGTAAASDPVVINFDTQEYALIGSEIELCSTENSPNTGNDQCPAVTFSFPIGINGPFTLYADVTPVEPFRLAVTSTGFGPNGSMKQLEGVLQKNFLNDMPSTSALTLLGPGANLVFGPGSGTPTYCGVDPDYEPGEEIPQQPTCVPNPNTTSGPAIGVSDQSGLDTVLTAAGNTAIIPPPDIISDGPEWQQSAAAMDAFVQSLRQSAQNSGTYIPDGDGTTALQQGAIGNFAQGTGITFCEGACSVGPYEGGGILVVTGNFEYSGNFDFRGLILVTGSTMHRNGAGNGVILGNVVVAPYDPNNLAAGFSSPTFTSSGGGTSDIIFNGLSATFDGTSAISNFMLGVAEK